MQDDSGFYQIATDAQYKEWEQRQTEGIARRDTFILHKQDRKNAISKAKYAATRAVKDSAAVLSNHLSSFPTRGEIHGLVILVEFPDRQFSDSTDSRQYYQDFMMKKGFNDLGSHGSVHDFFIDNSMGVFNPQFDVYGPVMVSNPVAYYGENDKIGNDLRPQEMIIEACRSLEDSIDFSLYDNDKDGYIDVVHVIFAGEGENNTLYDDDIWPHSWSILSSTSNIVKLDDLYLDDYVCTGEMYNGYKDGIGTFCHEFCHALGLVDSYNTKGSNFVNGDYDLMDTGLYLGGEQREGRCPCALNAYERYELGWLTPDTLFANKYKEEITVTRDTTWEDYWKPVITITRDTTYSFIQDKLSCMTTTNSALILSVRTSTTDYRDGEYYLFENRQQTGWDSSIPGHGMLAWHIDFVRKDWFSNMANTSLSHPCIYLVKADNRPSEATYSSDPFPGTRSVKRFTEKTTPALLGWDEKGKGSGMNQSLNNAAITEIKEILEEDKPVEETIITFSFKDDGPDTILGIDELLQDSLSKNNWDSFEADKSSNRVWRNGQLLIKTASGYFDLQGRLIE